MKTDLATLDRDMATAVTAAIEIAKNIEPTDPSAAELIHKLTVYDADARFLRGNLAREGIAPIAILPTDAWEHIRASSGLVTFHSVELLDPSGVSRQFDFKPLEQMLTVARSQAVKTAGNVYSKEKLDSRESFVGALLFTLLWLSPSFWLEPTFIPTDMFLGSIVFVSMIMIISGLLTRLLTRTFVSKPYRKRIDQYEGIVRTKMRGILERQLGASPLFRTFWPENAEGYARDWWPSIRIALPEPPDAERAVIDRILRGRYQWSLRIDADTDAIRFLEDPVSVLLDEAQRAERRAIARRNDPIVTVSECSAVAILATWGDSAIETSAIDEALAMIGTTEE